VKGKKAEEGERAYYRETAGHTRKKKSEKGGSGGEGKGEGGCVLSWGKDYLADI